MTHTENLFEMLIDEMLEDDDIIALLNIRLGIYTIGALHARKSDAARWLDREDMVYIEDAFARYGLTWE